MSYITAAGNFKATIKDAYVTELGANKTPAFVIEFETDDGSVIKYNGWMSEKAYPYTLEQLAKLGFDETLPPQMDAAGKPFYKAKHFSVKEVELVVVMEAGLKDPTKEFAKIKWINIPGEAKFKNEPTTGKLPSDFKSQMAAARARTGAAKPTSKVSDELGF